jgi:hypothetical protein
MYTVLMIIPVGFAQASFLHNLIGSDKKAVCTFGVELQGTDFGENRAADLAGIWETRVMPQMTDVWVFDRATLKYGPVSTGPTFESVSTTQGGASGDSTTPQVATLVRKTTALGGRKNRGRLYVPGVPEAQVGPTGALTSTYRTTLQTLWTGVLSDLATANMPMVILHASSSDPTTVASLVVDEEVATQRRRLR